MSFEVMIDDDDGGVGKAKKQKDCRLLPFSKLFLADKMVG